MQFAFFSVVFGYFEIHQHRIYSCCYATYGQQVVPSASKDFCLLLTKFEKFLCFPKFSPPVPLLIPIVLLSVLPLPQLCLTLSNTLFPLDFQTKLFMHFLFLLRLSSSSYVIRIKYAPTHLGAIPDGVTGIFHWHNPAGRTMVLGLTQTLTEMSTRNIFCGVKSAGA